MALWGVTHRGMATHNIRGNEGEQRMGNMDHINSGDETAIIPVIDMAATKEDTWEDTARPRLPHTGFGGYQPAAVDAAIGDYERRLGQFTRNYTQTVKRAADTKRRYAPGEGSIPPVLLSGVSKGVPPLAHDFACKV